MEKIIQSTGFYRAKTASLIALGQALCDRYGGEVPGKLKDLITLPGVGRKTANVVLGNAFGVAGITVDTHFARLARRFAWTTQTDPVKIESDVAALFPRSEWTNLSHRWIRKRRRNWSRRARSRDTGRPGAGLADQVGGSGGADGGAAPDAGPGPGRPALRGTAAVRRDCGSSGSADRAARPAPAPPRRPA